MTDVRRELLDRVHALLPADREAREAPMFGGVSVMLDDALLVAAGKDGSLLVRVDPERRADLLTRDGAGPAVMGAKRRMGPEWVRVDASGLGTEERLAFWVGAALEHAEQRGDAED